MAENVKSLRRRLRSIKNTKQITRAMEMVSAAKLRRSQELFLAGKPYALKLQELIGRLGSGANIDHPLFQKREVRRRYLVVVTSDRGLAGSFNAQIIKRAEVLLREATVATELILIGRKGYDYFKSKRWPIVRHLTDLGGRASGEMASGIADQLMEEFTNGAVDEVLLLYNSFVSTLVYRPVVEKLLPLDSEELLGEAQEALKGKAEIDYLMEPTPEEVFRSVLPRFVRSKIYIMLAEQFTAEHSARMVAMSGATKNCEDLIESVSLRMNKARQAAITKEIIEVVSGAQALSG